MLIGADISNRCSNREKKLMIKQTWHTHGIEYYLVIKMNELLIYADMERCQKHCVEK